MCAVVTMENITQRFRGVATVAKDGMDSGGSPDRLINCGDVDQQLAQVASAKLCDIPAGLLEEIF